MYKYLQTKTNYDIRYVQTRVRRCVRVYTRGKHIVGFIPEICHPYSKIVKYSRTAAVAPLFRSEERR